jgi:hypothetical protein
MPRTAAVVVSRTTRSVQLTRPPFQLRASTYPVPTKAAPHTSAPMVLISAKTR